MTVHIAQTLGVDHLLLSAVFAQNPIDQIRRSERQDRVHVVPQLPFGQHFFRRLLPARKPLAKAIPPPAAWTMLILVRSQIRNLL